MKIALASGLIVLGLGALAWAQPASHPASVGGKPGAAGQPGAEAPPALEPLDWKKLEPPVLSGHLQLTSREMFLKAGEAYFSPDDQWIIFQAIPVPAAGKDADKFYSMYVAKLTRDSAGQISGIQKPILVSPPGSANTCGWFHPTEAGRVIFGSTIMPPATDQKSGFQVGSRTYTWMFPQETEVVTRLVPEMLPQAAGVSKTDTETHPLFSRPDYDAECSFSKDGRFVLYAHVRETRSTEGRADADIWVYDTKLHQQHVLVNADGYDGGPFFSPDGRRICYRSDRFPEDPKRKDLLQLFVADLKFDKDGVPVGIEREYQITDNGAVNWAPFWHPSGKFLVYGTSEITHMNYEVFAVEIDDAKLRADGPGSPAAGTLRRTRVTSALGADVLPVFNSSGTMMMWTAQRGPMVEGEQKPSSQLWVAKFDASALKFDGPAPSAAPGTPGRTTANP